MRKVAFVIPWFGLDIPGGAEAECRETALHLLKAGVEVEILTTCVKDFFSDWSKNHWKEGEYKEKGLVVRRFKADKRDSKLFDEINAKFLSGQKVSAAEQKIFLQESIRSTKLESFIKRNNRKYNYVFIPYMFGTTYYGIMNSSSNAYILPCLHDEPYAYISLFEKMFKKVKGIIYNARSEQKLLHRIYKIGKKKEKVIGMAVEAKIGDSKRFREKYEISSPYVLYVGKKDKGKNVHLLIDYFTRYQNEYGTDMKLVLVGAGKMELPEDVIDLGFVSPQDKYDAMTGSVCLCNPSVNESFSIVIMESWLCGRPVIVNSGCLVTKDHCMDSDGGLWFDDYDEFKGCLDYYINNPDKSDILGGQGKDYVLRNYSKDAVVSKYMELIKNAN